MDDFSSAPEQLPVAPETVSHSPEQSGESVDLIQKAKQNVSKLERLKETSKKQSSTHDDEDQEKAIQAAKASKRPGRYMTVMDGQEIDLNLVTSAFFTKSTKKVIGMVRRDVRRAVEWLASLRAASQAWDGTGSRGKHLPVVILAVVLFWKI